LLCVASVVAAGIAFYTYPMNLLVLNPLEAIALAVVFLGFTYYFRVRPSIKMNRAMYVLLGSSPIGLVVIFVFAFIGLPNLMIGIWPSLIINVAAPYIIGAFVGDWIGGKRNYQLPRPRSILLGIVVLIALFAVLYIPYEYPPVHTATTITTTANGG
jgi:hypothetical protein